MRVRVIDYIFLLKKKCTVEEEGIGERVGLSTSEMHCIEALEPKELVSGIVLSKRMGLSTSRGSRIIESLMEKALLRKEIDRSDRRYSVISLTKRGERVHSHVEKSKLQCEKRITEGMDPEQIKQVKEGLRTLLNVM